MKGETTTGLQERDGGTLRFYGHKYTATVVKVFKTRASVRFFVGPQQEPRERTVSITWDPLRFEVVYGGCFLPGLRFRNRRASEVDGDQEAS